MYRYSAYSVMTTTSVNVRLSFPCRASLLWVLSSLFFNIVYFNYQIILANYSQGAYSHHPCIILLHTLVGCKMHAIKDFRNTGICNNLYQYILNFLVIIFLSIIKSKILRREQEERGGGDLTLNFKLTHPQSLTTT